MFGDAQHDAAHDTMIGYPDEEQPLLSFRDGRYAEAFIALSPFTPAYSWAAVVAGAGLASLRELNVALRTLIGGLRPEFAREDLAAQVDEFCTRAGLEIPAEGQLLPALLAPVARGGLIAVEDEFGDRRTDASLSEAPALLSRYRIARVESVDGALAATVHWDSFFALVFGPPGTADACRAAGLEGFAATARTTHRWELP
jgi:hypothetical protein